MKIWPSTQPGWLVQRPIMKPLRSFFRGRSGIRLDTTKGRANIVGMHAPVTNAIPAGALVRLLRP